MCGATHPYIIMPSLIIGLGIWMYVQSRKTKIRLDIFTLEDALVMIDELDGYFSELMSVVTDEEMRKQILLFLNDVVEGINLGIAATTRSSQQVLTEWAARMSTYAYEHFRRKEWKTN